MQNNFSHIVIISYEGLIKLHKIEETTFSYIEEHKEEMLSFLRKLVSIDTQVPPGRNYDALCKVLSDKLSELDCSVDILEAPEEYLELSGAELMGLKGPRSNLIARYSGRKGKPVLHVSAHIDTAAIQKEGWTHDPLGGKVTKTSPYGKSSYDQGGGYIWGRGVADDKGELVTMIMALEALHETGTKLDGDLVLTGNCDEEIGGVAGLGYLMNEGKIRADYGMQWDGGLDGIGLAAQGRTRFLVRTIGKSYHGQVPVLGINAIEKMSKINLALTNYWRNVLLKRKKPVPGISLGEELESKGVKDLTAMLNIGTIKGGIQGATVPDTCEEEVLRGMIPGEAFEDVRKEFINVLEGVKATDSELCYELEVINTREGYLVSTDEPYIIKARRIIKEITGRVLPFTGTLASTDMNYQVNPSKSIFTGEITSPGMPCFNLGLGSSYSNAHKQDENLCIDELEILAKIASLMYIRILGV